MSRIKKFGERLKGIAENHNFLNLSQYGSEIIVYADNFDVIGIEDCFNSLVNGILQLNKMWEEFNEK